MGIAGRTVGPSSQGSAVKGKRRHRVWRIVRWAAGIFLLLCLLLILVSALSNLGLPTRSVVVDRLSDAEKARLTEVFHLRRALGDKVWPGWGQARIPVILYNEEYAFLVACPDPATGWFKMPGHLKRGSAWEIVPDDLFDGEVFYRQRLPDPDATPQSFTVLVGDSWTASMQTKEWMAIALASQVRKDVPTGFKWVVPYRLVIRLLLNSSDFYICGVLHESFHAYQGTVAPARLEAAENAVQRCEAAYPWNDSGLQAEWRVELDLLVKAVRATSREEQAELAQAFLAQRDKRRAAHLLGPELVDYERQREWLEGLAKYVELEVWRQAATTADYQALPALSDDPDFKGYTTFEERWRRETAQIGWAIRDHDGRFYYTGMGQAVLLDALMPDWKGRIFADGVGLEDLLAEAIRSSR